MAKKEENEENICHWNACGTQYDTAEDLFNHVCSNHIGRKSAGTLSLECKWTGCHAKASKRDHLTSHCRVHIALKPHVCTICTKAFKRPQDLKKHEKIHSEDHHMTYKSHKAAVAAAQAQVAQATALPALPSSIAPSSTPAFPMVDAKGNPVATPQLPFPFGGAGLAGYPYPYAFLPGQALPGQVPGVGVPGVDQLAQLIALQTHLNAQAAQASFAGMPGMQGLATLPGQPAPQAFYPATTLGAQAAALNAQALSPFLQGGVFPFGATNAAYNFSAPPPSQPIYAQPLPQHSQPQQMTPPATSSPPQPHIRGLYPSLPASLYPNTNGSSLLPPLPSVAVKHETDLPSPANSARSHHPSPYSSSLSPGNVPGLSPPSLSTPENSFSPSPSLDLDAGVPGIEHRRNSSISSVSHGPRTNHHQVAGKKRAFDEAAGSFLGDLQNKRFADAQSMTEQLDALSSFLLTPEMSTVGLAPLSAEANVGGAAEDSGSGSSASGSDYGVGGNSFEREEVDTLNQLLLTLNQSLDDPNSSASSGSTPGGLELHSSLADLTGPSPAAMYPPHPASMPPPSSLDYHSLSQLQHRPIAGLPSSAAYSSAPSYNTTSTGSLYPTLPASLASSSVARPTPAPMYSGMYGYPAAPFSGAEDPLSGAGSAHLRLSKPTAAPTIANDYRPTQYHHMARLQRAAPLPSEVEIGKVEEVEGQMDVDEDMKDAAAALLMAAAGAGSAGKPKPKLPSLATALGGESAGSRLPPLQPPSPSSTRLPSIRSLLSSSAAASSQYAVRSRSMSEDPSASPTSPAASFSFSASYPPPATSSTATSSSSTSPTSTSSTSMYPSLASLTSASTSSARPVSAGGVERLTHRVHKLRLPSTSSTLTTLDGGDHDLERSSTTASSSILESEADLSETSDEGEDDGEEEFEVRGGAGGDREERRKSRHRDKKSRVESPEPYLQHEGMLMAVKAEEEEEDVKPVLEEDADEEEEAEPKEEDEVTRRAQLEFDQATARRRATLAYLVMYVNATYRAQLAKKQVKDVRRAIGGKGAGQAQARGGSGLKEEVVA
ncbi:hypothetical protein JCM11641_007326 [Rhodosporidiobolus odoratus]